MARINIENSLWTRGEWLDLVAKTGSADTAIGSLVRVWMVSQRHWFPDRKPIPFAVWKRERLNDAVIECGLAEKQADGIYVRGSEEQFAWLFDAQIAGQKSAEARKEKAISKPRPKNSKVSQPRSTAVEPQSTDVQGQSTDVEGVSTSLLSSLSSSLSSPTLSSNSLVRGAHGVSDPHAPPVDSITPTAQVWRAYKNAYRRRYHHDPTYNAKVMGQMRAFVGRVPASEAPLIAEFFVSHPKTFYVQKLHDFGLCLSDAESLRTQWLAGSPVTDGMVKEYRQKASQAREKGIAEILAEQSQPISQQALIDARGHDDSV